MSYQHICLPCILRYGRPAGPAGTVARHEILSRLIHVRKDRDPYTFALQKRQLKSSSRHASLIRKTLSSRRVPRVRPVASKIRLHLDHAASEAKTAPLPNTKPAELEEAQQDSIKDEDSTHELSTQVGSQTPKSPVDGHSYHEVATEQHADLDDDFESADVVESSDDAADDEAASSQLDSSALQSLTNEDTLLKPLDLGQLNVPGLSFDLSRVLFNPGVYQLQDPRSRVYNFDPYLQKVMPVSEFDFNALNRYITSSEDDALRQLAVQREKRYVGSSSSMSSALSHFHFLLSSWREIHLGSLSKDFRTDSTNFTRIQRAPSAIFLRWRDGVYAVDADKEFDSANILMSLGRSMEKLLTSEKHEYERYRRSNTQEKQEWDSEPEHYHYGEMGKFLLRSQLDAHDPRLPGTGVFDLKTRAVVAVRMALGQHEKGLGYQIKERQGTWESYEREYYDMIRSAFLKYSLQVRMGRMDGVFVTYHNIERIFGFQYIALPEMDLALHGQTDPSLGDREFGFSVKLMSDIFDQATEAFPEQSIRFHFETRASNAKVREKIHRMYIFAEPMSEEQIQGIQKSKNAEIAAYEERLMNPSQHPNPSTDSNEEEAEANEHRQSLASLPLRQDNAADVDFLDNLGQQTFDAVRLTGSASPTDGPAQTEPTAPGTPLMGFELVVRNMVHGHSVVRPEKIAAKDKWTVDYNLTTMKEDTARAKYAACKLRRKSATRFDDEGHKTVTSYFQNLFKMSESGAIWQRKQDELDARKEPVILYKKNNGKADSGGDV